MEEKESDNTPSETYEYDTSGILEKDYTLGTEQLPKGTFLLINRDEIDVFGQFYHIKAYLKPGTNKITHFNEPVHIKEDFGIFKTRAFEVPRISTNLTTLHINTGCDLCDFAFFDSKLKEFEGNCKLGIGVFSHSKLLKKVTLTGIESIPNETFFRCKALEQITVNADSVNVKTIGKHAFRGCSALRNIEFGAVEEMQNYAFAFSGLQIVNLPNLNLHRTTFRGCREAMFVLQGDTPVEYLKRCHSIIRNAKADDPPSTYFPGLFIDTVADEVQRWTWYFYANIGVELFELYLSAKQNRADVEKLKQYDKDILRGLFRKEIKEKRQGSNFSGQVNEVLTFLGEVYLTEMDPLRETTSVSYCKPLYSMLDYELASEQQLKAHENYRFFGETLSLCFRASSVKKTPESTVIINAYKCKEPLRLLEADCWRNQLFENLNLRDFEDRLYEYCRKKNLDGWRMRTYTDNISTLEEAEYEICISKDTIFKKLEFDKIKTVNGSELQEMYNNKELKTLEDKIRATLRLRF